MSDAYVAALAVERAHLLAAGKADRVKAVDDELARLGVGPKTPVVEAAVRPPAETAAMPKPRARRG